MATLKTTQNELSVDAYIAKSSRTGSSSSLYVIGIPAPWM